MKKILPTGLALLFIINAFAQTTTVTLRPHFSGVESFVGIIDASCNPTSTMHSTPVATDPVLSYMAWTNSGCAMKTRALFRFAGVGDTAVIPHISSIVSAKLYLYGVPSTPTGDYGNSTYSGSPYAS